MLRFLVSICAFLLIAASLQAGVLVTRTFTPASPGVPGSWWTDILTVQTDDGSQIVGFDFGSEPYFGIFGAIHQVNPLGLPTIFQDNNVAFAAVGEDVGNDTQFMFKSSDLIVLPSFSSESEYTLRAVFASPFLPLGTSVPFLQVCDECFTVMGTVTVSKNGEMQNFPIFSGALCPEPSVVGLAVIALTAVAAIRRKRFDSKLRS